MLVYEGIKSKFIEDVDLNAITDEIYNKYREKFHRNVSKSEINSWRESMLRMRGILADERIPANAGVAIEYNIPHTSKRIDFILSGYDKNKNNSIIIVELKQWETCNAVYDKDAIVETYVGGAVREVTHPSYQAWSYASLINSYNQTVYEENIKIHPCAFLHNYDIHKDDSINSEQYQIYIKEAPVFGSKDFVKLRSFIKKYIITGDDKEGIYKIENGKIRPSKMLQDAFSNILKGNKEFVLIDDQKLIYEKALSFGMNTILNQQKNVLIVEGGPGTGKSVIALNLLKQFLNRNFSTFYVSKNRAPREVIKAKLKIDKLSKLNALFKSSGCFVETQINEYDVLIVDEAHRLNEKSGLYMNSGDNQIKEIINASKFSIFFIDENQRVTLKDIGSIAMIEQYANELNAGIYKMELKSQFRCDGSDGYLAWLDNILEIKNTANYDFDYKYEFKIFDDPNSLRHAIQQKNKRNNKSRLVAGYCWNWFKADRNNSEVFDITIPEHNFAMSWNLGKTNTWAIDASSVNEVGCIHTCQGLEFDYVGVIIGDDLIFKDEHVTTDYTKRAKTDCSLRGIRKIAKLEGELKAQEISSLIIKNTYKTLMTRGLKGCYIYCTNKELQQYFRSSIQTKK